MLNSFKDLPNELNKSHYKSVWMSIIKTRILCNKLDYAIVTQREKTSKREIGMPRPLAICKFVSQKDPIKRFSISSKEKSISSISNTCLRSIGTKIGLGIVTRFPVYLTNTN